MKNRIYLMLFVIWFVNFSYSQTKTYKNPEVLMQSNEGLIYSVTVFGENEALKIEFLIDKDYTFSEKLLVIDSELGLTFQQKLPIIKSSFNEKYFIVTAFFDYFPLNDPSISIVEFKNDYNDLYSGLIWNGIFINRK